MANKNEGRRTKAPAKLTGRTVKIRQIGSVIGCTDRQRATVRGLGLRRMHHTVTVVGTPEVLGMLDASRHLLRVEEA